MAVPGIAVAGAAASGDGADTFCHLIYPSSTPWHGTSQTDLVLFAGDGSEVATRTVAGVDQYQLMVEHFANSVLADVPLKYPAEEAALNMRTVEALYRSARAGGAPVTL